LIRVNRPNGGLRPTTRLVSLIAVVSLAIATLMPADALASPVTLRRSFSNMIQGPLDMLLSPITSLLTLANNINDIEDSAAVRIVYPIPGWIWLAGLDFGSGGIRAITGVLEILPGVILFPFKTDIAPLFDPVVDASGLIEWDNPLAANENPWLLYNPLVAPFAIPVKFGINYTHAEY
jgi:hypothetical protein